MIIAKFTVKFRRADFRKSAIAKFRFAESIRGQLKLSRVTPHQEEWGVLFFVEKLMVMLHDFSHPRLFASFFFSFFPPHIVGEWHPIVIL